MLSSQALSRTITKRAGSDGVPIIRKPAPGLMKEDVSQLAERSFQRAMDFVLDNWQTLPATRATAVEINRILTDGLVSLSAQAKTPWKLKRVFAQIDLATRALAHKDPVREAEIYHHELSAADACTDANGRTARLMADLVLLKNGLAPAHYTDMDNYFSLGSSRSPQSREAKIAYFAEAVRRGSSFIKSGVLS